MAELVNVLVNVFYAATLASLAYFLHKVLWLVQYRRIQGELVERAVRRLEDTSSLALRDWDTFETTCWASTLGDPAVRDPAAFLRRTEEGLAKLRSEIKASRRSIEQLMGKALVGGRDTPEVRAVVLSLRRLSHPPAGPAHGPPGLPPGRGLEARTTLKSAPEPPGEAMAPPQRVQVTIDLGFPSVDVPKPPDPRLYELNVRSRYGFVRRALVFCSGIADVVYSSQHVALMSQNANVPTGVLVRRLSLVGLVIGVVLVDMIFGARRALTEALASLFGLTDNLATALAFAVWMGGYGALYLVMYLRIRRRYQVNVRRLRHLREREGEHLAAIRTGYVRELVQWARGYAHGLDSAVEVTLRHAQTLVDHTTHRLRRRVAPPELLDGAKAVADALFVRLPEARGELQDAAAPHPHSFAHHVWPRSGEMQYQAELAQYRAAWQDLELTVSLLRRERPDPAEAHALWRSAVTYATLFAHLMPAGTAESLKRGYATMVDEVTRDAGKDLEELDRKLGELARALNDQLESARGLVESRVEMTNQQIQAAVAALTAEIIQVREQARMEAMAFEI